MTHTYFTKKGLPIFDMSVGFDRLFDIFDELEPLKTQITYPPYNIHHDDDGNYTIELAVAGYSEKDIEATYDESKHIVTIIGDKTSHNESTKFIHRGISSKKFERKFILAENAKIADVSLKDGMLRIWVVVEVPKQKITKLNINN